VRRLKTLVGKKRNINWKARCDAHAAEDRLFTAKVQFYTQQGPTLVESARPCRGLVEFFNACKTHPFLDTLQEMIEPLWALRHVALNAGQRKES
jgi:hypothetical protein